MTSVDELLAGHPLPRPEGTKDERGSALVIGGPASCPGGCLLAAEAALRAGAGRVQACVHPSVAPQVAVAVPEVSVFGWEPTAGLGRGLLELVAASDAVVIGPGYSDGLATAAAELARRVGTRPLVLDAGALLAARSVGDGPELILAPNTGEAIELLGDKGSEEDLALALGKELGRPLAVRGTTTVITDGEGGLWTHRGGASGLGTPGSGDVLMGLLVALLARGVPALAALAWAVAVHGRAGEVVERTTPVGYLARDVVHAIPNALDELCA